MSATAENAVDLPAPRRPPLTSDVDLVGEFIRMREQAGSRLRFPVGIVRRGSEEPEWTIYSHVHRDGLGGIMHALQEAGYRIRRFPQFRDPSPPSPLALRLAVARAYWTTLAHRKHPWRSLQPRPGPQHGGHAWYLFSRPQTQALLAFARSRGVTLSTLLFWCANRAIPADLLREPAAPRSWVMTVNLRGPLRLPTEFGNLSSGMDVPIRDGATLGDLHATIAEAFRRNAQWGRLYWTWHFKTPERLQAFHRRWPRFALRFQTGVFSNAGEFPRDYVEPTERSGPVSDIDALILGGVTGPIHPISCVPLSWNGRLGLSLCLAAQLVDDLDETKRRLALWVAEILRHVEPVDPSAVRDAVRGLSWDAVCRASRASY